MAAGFAGEPLAPFGLLAFGWGFALEPPASPAFPPLAVLGWEGSPWPAGAALGRGGWAPGFWLRGSGLVGSFEPRVGSSFLGANGEPAPFPFAPPCEAFGLVGSLGFVPLFPFDFVGSLGFVPLFPLGLDGSLGFVPLFPLDFVGSLGFVPLFPFG